MQMDYFNLILCACLWTYTDPRRHYREACGREILSFERQPQSSCDSCLQIAYIRLPGAPLPF